MIRTVRVLITTNLSVVRLYGSKDVSKPLSLFFVRHSYIIQTVKFSLSFAFVPTGVFSSSSPFCWLRCPKWVFLAPNHNAALWTEQYPVLTKYAATNTRRNSTSITISKAHHKQSRPWETFSAIARKVWTPWFVPCSCRDVPRKYEVRIYPAEPCVRTMQLNARIKLERKDSNGRRRCVTSCQRKITPRPSKVTGRDVLRHPTLKIAAKVS